MGWAVFFFTILLGITLVQAALGILTLSDHSSQLGLIGVGFLVGGRVSDWWNSHYGKWLKGYRGNRGFKGNPGLRSSWFYLLDAALLIGLLLAFDIWSGDTVKPIVIGILTGAILFIIIIPVIKLFRKKGSYRSETPKWKADTPIPDWAA